MADERNGYQVNLFKPKQGYMASEVAVILAVLICWAGATFGFQLLLRILAAPDGSSFLTRFTFFNLPFHFWFTGQMLPLWFVIICVVFNLAIDRLTERHSRRRDGFYE